jgi:protein involved in polysaccharide export with SLBB domain
MLLRFLILFLIFGLSQVSTCQQSAANSKPVAPAEGSMVYVVGDVHKAGGYSMESGRMTVLQVISLAEGPSPTAALNKAVLIRNTPAGKKQIPLGLKNILAAKAPDISLQAGDIVFIPKSVAQGGSLRPQLYDAPPVPPLEKPAQSFDR